MISDERIDNGKAFDWGNASAAYAQFRDIYPAEFYQRLVGLGLCVAGQRVLDLGTGTGVLPRNLYRFGAKFVGADVSENQIEQAKRLSRQADMDDINYVVAAAETIHFPFGSFDVITACQCFIYFDKAVALPKIHAMLKPDGRFCVIWVAWLPEEDTIAQASEQLVLKHNPAWTGGGYTRPAPSVPAWASPLFAAKNILSYDMAIPFTRESWHGRMMACRGIGASDLTEAEKSAFAQEHMQFMNTCPARFDILHHISIIDLIKVE